MCLILCTVCYSVGNVIALAECSDGEGDTLYLVQVMMLTVVLVREKSTSTTGDVAHIHYLYMTCTFA